MTLAKIDNHFTKKVELFKIIFNLIQKETKFGHNINQRFILKVKL